MRQKTVKTVCSKSIFNLPVLDGHKLIGESFSIFNHFIDPCFRERGMNKKGLFKPAMAIAIYEIIKPTTFLRVFKDLPGPWEKKWLSQHQVVKFCSDFSDILAPVDSFSLFLVKKDEYKPVNHHNLSENLAIIMVEKIDSLEQESGLSALFLELKDFDVWFSPSKIRVIAPKHNS